MRRRVPTERKFFTYLLWVTFSLAIMCGCNGKKTPENEFFRNGRIKKEYVFANGLLLTTKEYDSITGGLAIEKFYKEDTIVDLKDYYADGVIFSWRRKSEGNTVIEEYFYPNGRLQLKRIYQKGSMLDAERYFPDGVRDTIPFPIVEIADVKKDEVAMINGKFVNVPLKKSGVFKVSPLVLGYGVDTISDRPIVIDTAALMDVRPAFKYALLFKPKYIGLNRLYCSVSIQDTTNVANIYNYYFFEARFYVTNTGE